MIFFVAYVQVMLGISVGISLRYHCYFSSEVFHRFLHTVLLEGICNICVEVICHYELEYAVSKIFCHDLSFISLLALG